MKFPPIQVPQLLKTMWLRINLYQILISKDTTSCEGYSYILCYACNVEAAIHPVSTKTLALSGITYDQLESKHHAKYALEFHPKEEYDTGNELTVTIELLGIAKWITTEYIIDYTSNYDTK